MRATRGVFPPEAQPANPELIDRQRRERHQLALDMQAIFSTPQGQNVLKWMRLRFRDRPLLHSEPSLIVAAAAQHDVIIELEELMAETEREEAIPDA